MASKQAMTRIACVQLDSEHGQVATNIDAVKRTIADLASNKTSQPIDLLVLPELAFTGYVFRDYQEIKPLLESTTTATGASLAYASEVAKELSAYVIVGFPELAPHSAHNSRTSPIIRHDARPRDVQDAGPAPPTFDAYNSAALFDRRGELIHTFRKHFLFDDDKRWASEGTGFEALQLPGIGKVCVAICMDLNPYEFRTSFDECELAAFCHDNDVDMLIIPMAWLLPKDEVEVSREPPNDNKVVLQPSVSTINYWAARCQPFFKGFSAAEAVDSDVTPRVPRYLITANRTGTEGSSTFAGSSCVIQFRDNDRPTLLGALTTSEEGILIVDLPTNEP